MHCGQSYQEKHRNMQLRAIHRWVADLGMDDETYRAFLHSNFRVYSSKDLTPEELDKVITLLSDIYRVRSNKSMKERIRDTWRKRVMGVIASWLRQKGQKENCAIIKEIACRTAKTDDFNAISDRKLIYVYNVFCSKTKQAINE